LLEISNNRLSLKTTIDGASKVIEAGKYLSDGQWHQIKIERNGKRVKLVLDNAPPKETYIESKA
jgi:hypothetical protein